jgi:hypothetical protein
MYKYVWGKLVKKIVAFVEHPQKIGVRSSETSPCSLVDRQTPVGFENLLLPALG